MSLLRTSSLTIDDTAPADQLARYCPRSLSIHSKRRFATRRTREYLSQIVGRPSRWQIACIESLIRREWATLVAERTGHPETAIRADREYQKLLDTFRRSIQPTPAPQPSLQDVLNDIARRRSQPEPDGEAA